MAAQPTPPSTTLYSSPISDCSARVRIGLNLKTIPYNLININLRDQRNQDPSYAQVNASQTVPTLVHNGTVITQSVAALEYLDELFPLPNPLLRQDTAARAQVRSLASIIATDTHPLLTHRVGRDLDEMSSGFDVKAWRRRQLLHGLEVFEAAIAVTAGRFSFGDEVTLADVCLVPALWTAERWGMDLSRFPIVEKVYRNLSERREFASAKQDPSEEM